MKATCLALFFRRRGARPDLIPWPGRILESAAPIPVSGDTRAVMTGLSPAAPTLPPIARPAGAEPFAALVVAHQAMVWRYLRLCGADPHEASDLTQDAFVRLYEGERRGELVHNPAAFLRAVARNLLIAARRRDRRRPVTLAWLDAVDEHVAATPGALDDARLEVLRACVERLAPRSRDAVRHHHLDGAPLRDTAARLQLGLEGTRSLLARARAALRNCVDHRIQEERRLEGCRESGDLPTDRTEEERP